MVTQAAASQPRPAGPRAAAAPRARPRHFPARYKIAILSDYDKLGRAGKTALLRRERLRASQISQWRAQVYAAALQALGGEPGSQPAHRIHASATLWDMFSEAAARHDPPYRPERLLRAFMRYQAGLTDHLPPRPEPASPEDTDGPGGGG
jgi:hypothetical protein